MIAYDLKQIQEMKIAMQFLSFSHSEGVSSVMESLQNEAFEIEWYNCPTELASVLCELLQISQFYFSVAAVYPEITAIFFPKAMPFAMQNVREKLGDYENLLRKMSKQSISEGEIETELLKVAMQYNRQRFAETYSKHI